MASRKRIVGERKNKKIKMKANQYQTIENGQENKRNKINKMKKWKMKKCLPPKSGSNPKIDFKRKCRKQDGFKIKKIF